MKRNLISNNWLAAPVILVALMWPAHVHGTTYTSNVLIGLWDVPATWSPIGVPGCGDTVIISGGTTVIEDASNCSGDLLVNGTLDMNNNYFFFEGTTFTNNGALISSAASGYGEFRFNGVGGAGGTAQNFAGAGTYNTNGRVDFRADNSTTVIPASGAVLNGLANWTIDGGSTLSLSYDFVVNGPTGLAQTTFYNNSTISGSGILKTHNNVTINSGGLISAPIEVVSGTTSGNGSNSGNFGPITIDSGTTFFESGAVAMNGDLTVNGTLDMNNNYFYFGGTTFTNNGALISSAASGYGEFRFNGVGHAASTTQNFAGAGTYNTNGRVDFRADNSTTVIPASGAVLNGLANWTIDGGSTLSLSNNFVVNGLTGSAQTTFYNNSTISGSGILKTHNNVTINSGGLITAPIEVVSGTTSGNGSNSGNFGPITVDSGATFFENGAVAMNGDLTVSGTLDTNNQYFIFGGTTFTNNGAIISSTPNGEFRFNGVGHTSGTTQYLAGTGTYNTNGRVVMHTVNSTTVTSNSSALLEGVFDNTIDGGSTFDNHGTMAPGFPPGQANVSGNLQLASTSNLSFKIGGTTAGTQYEVLNKNDSGTLTLNGTLTVRLINGFVPANSDVFTIVTTQQILAGSFSNVANGNRLTTADGGGSFQVTYNVLNNPVASRNVTLSNFQPNNVATPVIHPPSGPVIRKESIQITCATAGATIYYTVNGGTPTTHSTKYTGYFVITAPATVKARAFKGSAMSGVATNTYTKAR